MAEEVNPGGQPASVAAQAAPAATLDAYLHAKGSPIAGSGMDIVAIGREFDFDPRFLVALSGAETSFGLQVTAGENNVLNVLYNGHNSPFVSYRSAFHSAGKSIRNPRNRYNLASTATFYAHYCAGTCGEGLKNLDTFMGELGASTTSLTLSPQAGAAR